MFWEPFILVNHLLHPLSIFRLLSFTPSSYFYSFQKSFAAPKITHMRRLLFFFMLLIVLSATISSNAQTTYPLNDVASPQHHYYAFINATIVKDANITITNATMVIKDV